MTAANTAKMPAIPAPTPDPNALLQTCLALKAALELLAGVQPANKNQAAVTYGALAANGYATVSQVNTATTEAKTADYLADNPGLILETDKVWGAAAPVSITFGSTITPDLSTLINAYVTLTSNFTLAAPVNAKKGQAGVIELIQDATGSRIVTFNSAWHFAGTTPVLSTAASAIDLLYYYIDHTGVARCSLVKGT